ncbi:restriction endonuclease subunit S [Enterococcus faecalis]|uniref:restriction endonuclease subunit S n=1 Tax=Enterococcus faecalis TaxID=1351 RepID=UPI0011449628|nr:restriction endonuclease subunit S [Enterococcus faecalis]EGO5993187.1 restriction endonuclease subunit S [Enterococcus faecalis]EGO7569161.1 restriction endonuclease subunit S [Enterococcus faecalis]MBP4090180.1 restriction endonuclease subunit S [Enterococcus faecalis]MBP4098468.1 restriction endonuclease subunit S [Enterococcus faecalis]MBP4101235.1 restriction endonuclease subunit S [Enterococcus faecalis]
MSKKSPQLRFKGFTDDWEERKLGEVGYFYYGKSAPKWSVTEDAETPCVRYGELYTKYGAKISNIYSHTNINPKNLKFSTGNEVLVPRVGENPLDFSLCSWLSIPNVAIGEMISVYNTNENPLFISYYFRSQMKYEFAKRVEGGNVSNLYYSYLEDIDLYIPKLEEQIAISKFFEKLDDTIALHQRKLDLLKEQKKGYLQKMFPKNGAKVPELRFAGFADDWEQRKLGEISPLRGGAAFKSHLFKKEGVPIVRISNILENGFVGGEFAYYQQQENDEKYILPNQAIVLAMSGATTGKVSVLNNPDNKKVYQNQRVGYFLPTKTCDYKFISILVRTTLFHKQLESVLVAGAQPNISSKEVESFIFMIPSLLNEQRKIGTFFKQLDDTIALHQRKLDLLKEQKKGCLQKMFV